jgi:hypothetical protein
MARLFLSRQDWQLVAAGVAAGLLTSALVLYLFFTSLGDGGIDPALVEGRPAETPPAVDPGQALPDGPGRGLIGRLETGVARRLAATAVDARPLRGPITITMRDLVWNEEDGTRFARADFVSGQLNVAAAQRNDVVLNNVVVRRPVITLRQARPRDEWNFERVFAELLEGGPAEGPVRTIRVTNLQVVDGSVDVAMPDRRMAFQALQARLPLVVLSQPGLAEPYLRVSVATTQFVQRAPVEGRLALEARDGLFRFPEGRMQFDVASLLLDRTQLASLQGVWNPADGGFGITATGLAPSVRFEDVAFLMPEAFPATGEASFAWAVRPLPGDLTEATLTDLDARSGDSRVFGAMTVELGDEFFALRSADLLLDPLALALVEGFTGPLPYGGNLTGRVQGVGGDITFDLAANLTAPTVPRPFAVGVRGQVLLTDDEVILQRVDLALDRTPLAALRAIAPALPVDGVVTGRVSLRGPPTQAPLALDVRLELGEGIALVAGTVDLTGVTPRYDLSGQLVAVDVQAVLAPDVPPVALTADFTLRGEGFETETMTAAVSLAGRFTGWEAAAGDTIELVADIRGGTVDVQSLRLVLATADVSAAGRWRFVDPQSGALTYNLTVTSLRPFGPYLPVIGDTIAAGSVHAAGTLTGTLARMRFAGDIRATEVRSGEYQALALQAAYEIATGGGGLPEAVVNATGQGIVTPTAGSFTDAVLTVRMVPPEFALDLDARRPDGGVVEIAATGTVPDTGPRIILVERARFDMEQAQWTLAAPATIRWLDDEIYVEDLALEDAASEARLVLDGRVLPLTGLDARVQVAALPMGDVQRLLGQPVRLEGALWVEGTVRGAGAEPLVDLAFRVEDAVLEGVPVQRLEGRVEYRDQLTQVAAIAIVNEDGVLDVRASLPSVLQIGGDPVFALLDALPLSGSLVAEQFAIAPLAALAPVLLRDVTGVINAQVDLSGTADAPLVAGTANLVGGAMTVMDLNQRYTEITGALDFDGRRLVIEDLRARSDGWAVVGGQVILERVDNPVLDLSVLFEGFRPMGVENQRDAALFGRLAVSGAPASLDLTGSIRVDDGFVVIPQFGGPGVDMVDIMRPAPVMGRPMEPIADGGALQNLRITNLRVTAGDGAWFLADEARAQLSGELTINKVGLSTPVVGTLSGTRGQYTLVAGPLVRRFDVVAAQVRFLGSPTPNPAIDITARRIVFDPAGRQVDVDVRITGTMETPRIAIAGGDALGIAESELLSFLIFGQPTFALGGEYLPGEDLLQQTFVGGFAELMAIELERGLGGLGLDVFQIRLGTGGPFGGLDRPTLVLGRQLRPDVFITVETGLTALFGGGGQGEAPLSLAARLDWAFDQRSRLRFAWEPVYGGRAFRGAALALPLTDPEQQFLLELRRRWTY